MAFIIKAGMTKSSSFEVASVPIVINRYIHVAAKSMFISTEKTSE